MEDARRQSAGAMPAWRVEDLQQALLRRARFPVAGRRSRRSGAGLAHAGVSRRAIRRIGMRAAAALARCGRRNTAAEVVGRLSRGRYHDEQMLALEILDRLAAVWPEWGAEIVQTLSRSLQHPWGADRLAIVKGRLLARHPDLLRRHARWALSSDPLRRRAAALALLPRTRGKTGRGVAASRAMQVLRLLLQDPEPHRWVEPAVGQALKHYACRAPRTISRLLATTPTALRRETLAEIQRMLGRLPSAS